MDCRETRDEIEAIEDLKNKGHQVPEGIAGHLEDCTNCGEYHRASSELERQLFSKIKDLKIPAAPGIKLLAPRTRSPWRR